MTRRHSARRSDSRTVPWTYAAARPKRGDMLNQHAQARRPQPTQKTPQLLQITNRPSARTLELQHDGHAWTAEECSETATHRFYRFLERKPQSKPGCSASVNRGLTNRLPFTTWQATLSRLLAEPAWGHCRM